MKMITYAETVKKCRAEARKHGYTFRKLRNTLNGRAVWGMYNKSDERVSVAANIEHWKYLIHGHGDAKIGTLGAGYA